MILQSPFSKRRRQLRVSGAISRPSGTDHVPASSSCARASPPPRALNPQLAGLDVWDTLHAFYRADWRRRSSPQADFPGINERWVDAVGWRWIVYYLTDTREFAAQRVDHTPDAIPTEQKGPVVLLGALPNLDISRRSPSSRFAYTGTGPLQFLAEDDVMLALASAAVGDIHGLTKRRDFIERLVDRIGCAAWLLGQVFLNPESAAYQAIPDAMDARIERGTVQYVGGL